MRKSSFEETFERFFSRLNWYTDLLVKVTEDPIIILTEKKEIYEAFVLKIHVTWELLVENLLIDCLNRNTSKYAEYKATNLPRNLSKNICRCLLTGIGFFDTRGASETQKIAKDILVNKFNPFSKIPKIDAKRINEFYIIRNYLAHYSEKSKLSLMKVYKINYKFKNFREPGHFLCAHDRQTKQVRFANYIDSFINSADKMADFLRV